MQNLLLNSSNLFLLAALIFGLLIGSFLNVVIYRLPIMLQNSWRKDCLEFLQLPTEQISIPLNLWLPHSHCPHCQVRLRYWHNIPLLSYLALRGKCAACQKPIALRYPVIELLTGLLTAFVAVHYGWSLQGWVASLFTWSFIVLTVIDLEHQLLPDNIVLPLLWLSLLLNSFNLFTDLKSAVIGAAGGYLSLWSVANLFKLITGKVGMGGGDFKLLALIGALLGWQILPLTLVLSSALGLIVGLSWLIIKKQGHNTPIPFGPYLAIAGWFALVFNDVFIKFSIHFF